MAGNHQISQVNLQVTANTSGYTKELTSAKQQAASDLKQMGTSVVSFRNVATKEFTTAGKAAELLEKKNKLVIASLKDTSEAAKTQLKIVTDQYKQVQKAADDEYKQAQRIAAQKKQFDAENKEALKGVLAAIEKRTQAEKRASNESVKFSEQAIKAFKGHTDQTIAGTKQMSTAMGGLKTALAGVATSMAAAFTVQSAKNLLDTASTFNTLNQRIKTATKETGGYAVVQEKLYSMAIKNGAQMQDTVQVFQGLARSAKELGANNQQMLTLTNTMQQLGVISGASASNMSAGLQQFSQAMAGGVIHAEEWNSIVENIPEVAQRIAKGLGLSIGQTRQLMLDGKLLSKDVFDVLLKQSKQIDAEFTRMPRSMQQAYAGFETASGKALATLDQTLGATKSVVSGIDLMTSALQRFSELAKKPINLGGGKSTDYESYVGGRYKNRHQTQNKFFEKAFAGAGDIANAVNPFSDKKLTMDQALYNIKVREMQFQNMMDEQIQKKSEVEKVAPGQKLPPTPPKVDEKAAKKHGKDVQNAEDLLASMRAQNAELEAKLRHDDEAVTKEKALLKLSKDRTLTDAERNKYAKEINVLAAQHAALKRQEDIGKEKEKLGEILAGHKEKIELLKNELSGETETNSILTAQKEIRNAVKIGMKETAELQQKIRDAAKEEAVLRDGVKLKAIADSMRSQLDSTKAKNDAAAELVPILQAEEQIRKNITAGMEHNVAAQKEIRDLAKQQADEILQKQYEADSKKIGDQGKNLEDENQKLRLKLQGQEDSAKFLEAERDVRKQIEEATKKTAQHIDAIRNSNLSEQDKTERIGKVQDYANKLQGEADSKIQSIRQQTAENTQLNKALDDQEQIIKNIKDGTGSYKQKLLELNDAYKGGSITQKQWQKTADELWKNQTKASHTVGDAVKQMGNNLTQAIMSGTKLNDVFKNMGKTLVALAAQKLLFEPIANGLDNLASKLFGTGKYTQKPVMPGSGGQLASSGANSMLGNSLGGAYGGGNLSTGSGGRQLTPQEQYFDDLRNGRIISEGSPEDIARMFGFKQFAEGGYFGGGGPMLVGEKGPEIVWPQSGGWVQNNQSVMSMFGGYGAMSNNGGFSAGSGGRYGGALSDIGGWQQQLQSGYNSSNQQLGYYERQELSQKIAERYRSTMDWNHGDERMLAQVADDLARAQAREYLANPTRYKGVINDNEYARMTLRATYGTGAVDGVVAGGRAGWGAGDQMRANLAKAQALGVAVPQQLLDKAGFDAANWKNSQETFNPMGNMDPTNWIGRGSYHSMGVGAGEGNTNNGAVYGGDFWDPRTGANGSERMDAMGGKDFMWQKFHNFVGAGYENIKDMWSRFHNSNLSFGGGNFIGDPTYGPRQFPGFSGTTADRNKAAKGVVDQYGDNDPTNWRPGRKRIGDHDIGKYTVGGDIAVPHYSDTVWPRPKNWEENLADAGYPYKPEAGNVNGLDMSGGALKRRSDQTVSSSEEAKKVSDFFSKLLGGKYMPELGTIEGFKQNARKLINSWKPQSSSSDAPGSGSGLLEQIFKPLRGSGDSWKRQQQIDIPGLSALATGSDMDALMAGVFGMSNGKSSMFKGLADSWKFNLPQSVSQMEGLKRDSWAARKNTQAYDNQRMGDYLSQFMQPLDGRGLNRVESHINGIGWGGAVGSGRLSTSSDVFDNYGSSYGGAARMTDSQRLKTPYRNFADGFDYGYFGARTGADIGATSPRSGWQIQGVRQGIRSIKGYAKGGDVARGELALVGEKGPELIVPSTAGRVIPNDRLNTNSGAPVITLINNTGVQLAAPEVRQNSDGSIGLFLNAAGANAARGGTVSRGTKQAGRSVNR